MKLFNLKLKNSCFFRRICRVFRHCFFACFHFFMFSFLHFSFLEIFLGVFIVDCICSLHCFFAVVAVVTTSATDLRERFLLSGVFYLTLLSCFYQGFPVAWKFCLEGCRASRWGSKQRPGSSVCFNDTVFRNYMISRELYLNLSRCVNKLLVVKSLINVKHIN